MFNGMTVVTSEERKLKDEDLSSPKKNAISTPKKDKDRLARRRKVNKWSSLEDDTLRAGIEQYGVGR
ncbi:unnamed protein product [Prunus brigantina]